MRQLLLFAALPLFAADADLILHNGKILTADARFTTVQAMAIKGGRIVRTGASNVVIGSEKGPRTRLVNLSGKTVLPGLIDAHVHAIGAGLSEFKSKLPPLDSIADIQNYIRQQAKTTPPGEWIVVPRTLPPRLKEQRFPTKVDLDVITTHPVAFDGSYVWSANTMGLRISGITRNTPNPPGGEIVKGPDGEPNGILRAANQLLKGIRDEARATEKERLDALETMLKLYAASGLTTVGDRAVTEPDVTTYQTLKAQGRQPIRAVLTWRINASRPLDQIEREINARPWTTNQGDDWLKFGTFKVTLDGGQSVGTAYQRMPYGAYGRQLYGQTNPDARGTLFVDREKLTRIFRAARAKGWQLTSHAQGGAAIDVLLDAFEALDKEQPIGPTRSHVMHGSFMSEEAIARMKRMGILADVQAGWLHFDVPALEQVFGYKNMRYFFPLQSYLKAGIGIAGGSDHMIGHDKNRAVNPYNPFFNMWMAITRKTREGKLIYPEEKISREQALRMYTNGSAYLQFSEKSLGSLETGKLADLVVIDKDYLTCPEDEIRHIQPLATVVNGKVVYGTL
ncbi:MAG TPA: amidohydrolase [Bryobacteraceae bacterium]|nr:amidohydrolase [Bryobacteraceae bacterium]